MKTFQVRRSSASLGLFNERELRALAQKGKLLPSDEVDEGAGKWSSLASFLATLPAPSGSSPVASASPNASVSSPQGRNFYLHSDGRRIGPLELSKLEGMSKAGLIGASAMLEDVTNLGQLVPVVVHLTLPTNVASPSSPHLTSNSAQSQSISSVASSAPKASAAVKFPAPKAKVTYFELWWKTSLWIYGIGAVFGYLAGNLGGLIVSLVLGLFLAPIKGAFWAWIIWLFKR